ncbi:MAG: FKBP-type peptidyl-prolyl cis-trans isomerase [Nanoarchaeota archaeon]|nr:FKBP-type peptidyl-prolyl cis-trans isomerase [Nanoarchaeota archaeon]
MDIIKKGEFVEIKYTGYVNNEIFDSNIEEDLKRLNPEAKVEKTIVAVGEGMVVNGLDKALEGKEMNKEYAVKFGHKEGFGDRNKDLIRTIPLKVFTEKNIMPQAGMMFSLDNQIVRIVTISGGRVMADFNNPLAGKEIDYKFKIIRRVSDEKEKIESLFKTSLRFIPEFEIRDKIVIRGHKSFEALVKSFNDKFKRLIGKELGFEEKKEVKNSAEIDNSVVVK